MRQLVYTMFINNNHTWFHLLWKEKLGKTPKNLKILWKWFSENLLLFISFLTANFNKNSHFWYIIYFLFLKNVLEQTWNSFMTNFNLSEKIERLLLSKANFHPFLQLNCSNFRSKLFEALELPNMSKNQVQRGLCGVRIKNVFERQSFTKYLRLALVFMWNCVLPGKFSIYFSRVCC